MPQHRISPAHEYPGPEARIPLIIEVMDSRPLGRAVGTLVPPATDGHRCALWTGVGLVGHEIVVDLDWPTLATWVRAVVAARAGPG
ncbi:hypothetical protein [Jiangella asiatica]|uniref:Uncharacterized protein n=1 Tax=Jiangella asiatica TaxID=2530372 RepID=A0A4R5DNF2_9ACTN|nr:hypothetical protein [Jiangella asiatica]TDE13511.1 hypothetical protein E1269_05630 [Jiangella asiatica]